MGDSSRDFAVVLFFKITRSLPRLSDALKTLLFVSNYKQFHLFQNTIQVVRLELSEVRTARLFRDSIKKDFLIRTTSLRDVILCYEYISLVLFLPKTKTFLR
uniref:(northern house mosquito) hypothetical protein n=1 Tax=Culex pipiens TaxID=7175 RepID=A0A8D8JEK1_CULPI